MHRCGVTDWDEGDSVELLGQCSVRWRKGPKTQQSKVLISTLNLSINFTFNLILTKSIQIAV